MGRLQKEIERSKKYALKYGQKLDSDQLYLRLISNKIYSREEIEEYGGVKQKNRINEEKVRLAKELTEKHLKKINMDSKQ